MLHTLISPVTLMLLAGGRLQCSWAFGRKQMGNNDEDICSNSEDFVWFEFLSVSLLSDVRGQRPRTAAGGGGRDVRHPGGPRGQR